MIRPMTEEDLPEVLAIGQKCFSVPWSRRNYLESMELDFYILLIARSSDTGRTAGYAVLMDAAGEGNLMTIAVDPAFRRQKAAENLLSRLLFLGGKRGIRDFTLEVRKSNAPAVSLYKKFGFRTEGVRRGYYENPREDALIMWRRELDPVRPEGIPKPQTAAGRI